MIKPRSIVCAVAAGTVVLASCSASSTDFKKAAEKAITGSQGLKAGSTATCDTPADNKVNTTFKCTGTDSAGNTYNFVATITSKTRVEVTGATADTSTSDATGGSTLDTTPVASDTGASVATDAPTTSSAP